MPDLLSTADVMQRYQCERHTAASIMHKMPVLKVGGRLFVKVADLVRWEERRTQYPSGTIKRSPADDGKIPRRSYNARI